MRLDVEGRSRHPLVPVTYADGTAWAPTPEPVPDTTVMLTFDADPSNIRLARLVASGLMVERRFTVDEIEDLRIAVDEVCSVLVAHLEDATRRSATEGSATRGRIRASFAADSDAIAVSVVTIGRPSADDQDGSDDRGSDDRGSDDRGSDDRGSDDRGGDDGWGDPGDLIRLDPLTAVILEATVDEHRFELVEGRLRVVLRKARSLDEGEGRR